MGHFKIYLLLLVIGITGATGDILLCKWARSDSSISLWGAYAAWIASTTAFGLFMRCETYAFSAAVIMAMLVHVTITTVADWSVFGGRLNRMELLGVILGVVAIIVMEVGHQAQATESEPDVPVQAVEPLDAAEMREQ